MLTSIDPSMLSSSSYSARLRLFSSANILQIADVVLRVVFLLFLPCFQLLFRLVLTLETSEMSPIFCFHNQNNLAFPNIGIANFGYYKHWNSLIFGFFKHWNCEFQLFQTLESLILAFPNFENRNFAYSNHWNSLFLAFPNIGILNFGFSKHCNCKFWAFSNIGILNFGISKQRKQEFCLFQSLEFLFLAFPKIGIVNFCFSTHWNSKFWRSAKDCSSGVFLFQTMEL